MDSDLTDLPDHTFIAGVFGAADVSELMLQAAVEKYSKRPMQFVDDQAKRRRMVQRLLEIKIRQRTKYPGEQYLRIQGIPVDRDTHTFDTYLPNSVGEPEASIDLWESDDERSVQRARRKWYDNPDFYDMENDRWRDIHEVAALIKERKKREDDSQRRSLLSFLITGKCSGLSSSDPRLQPPPDPPKNKYGYPINEQEQYSIADDTDSIVTSYHSSTWVDPEDKDRCFHEGDIHLRCLIRRYLATGRCSSPPGQHPPDIIYIRELYTGNQRHYYVSGHAGLM